MIISAPTGRSYGMSCMVLVIDHYDMPSIGAPRFLWPSLMEVGSAALVDAHAYGS